jgi:hypothetical protein
MLLAVAGLLFSLFNAAPSAAESTGAVSTSFAVRVPDDPIPLKLSSPRLEPWGHTPKLRLIYYVADGQTPNDLDRRTILRELKLIEDFYAHYGLSGRHEDVVYEVQGRAQKDLPVEQYGYYYIKKALERRWLLVPYRTIVFTTFDVGLGAEMALTGLNDANTAKVECPRAEKGYAWWCGRPEAAHWGGSVHEVGHMLGLAHPDEYTAESPYVFSTGTGTYVYDEADAEKAVMIRHDRFFRHPDNGLLPHEIDLLYHRYHDAGARAPSPRS